MAPFVALNEVSKLYRRGRQAVAVLEKFNLEIAAGDFLAIMGPSGSGKTTLLNLIGGLHMTTSGTVPGAGEQLGRLSSGAPARGRPRHSGFFFQFYTLLPALPAERNV